MAREAILYTFALLGWRVGSFDVDVYRATVPISGASWGETFTVSLALPGVLEISSTCNSPLQLFDWGKNKQNVNHFLAYFSQKELREVRSPRPENDYLNEAGETPLDRVINEAAARGRSD